MDNENLTNAECLNTISMYLSFSFDIMNSFDKIKQSVGSFFSPEEKKEVVDDLAKTLLDDPDSLDVEFLNKTHPSFLKFNFSQEDLAFLQSVTDKLVQQPSIETLQKELSQIDQSRGDLGGIMAILFSRIVTKNNKIKELNKERLNVHNLMNNHSIIGSMRWKGEITDEDIPFLEEASEALMKDPSPENFERISQSIPKNKLRVGYTLTYIYGELNHLNTTYPIIIRSLRHYHPSFKNLSEEDTATLENVLKNFESNKNNYEDDELMTKMQLEAINSVPQEREDLRNAIVLLFYAVMFDGSFVFWRDSWNYKDQND